MVRDERMGVCMKSGLWLEDSLVDGSVCFLYLELKTIC